MTYRYATDYGKDLLTDINELINAPGMDNNAVVKDCLQRAYKRISYLEKENTALREKINELEQEMALLRGAEESNFRSIS